MVGPLADDDACLEFLWRRRFSDDGETAHCPTCGTVRRFHRVIGRRSYRCTSCSRDLHPTAGTILNRSKTPLHLWFRAMAVVAESPGPVSAKRLQREVGVTYKMACRMARLIPTEATGLVNALNNSQVGSVSFVKTVVAPSGPVWAAGEICTVAGDGTAGYGGDGGHGAAAQLNAPYAVTFDTAGNLFISDEGNNVVRMVDAAGTILTVAGTGVPGYAGDGGPAVKAKLASPRGLAVNDDGDLLIADGANHVIRKVDGSGTISTIAGTGTPGYLGDDGPATDAQFLDLALLLAVGENLLVADYGNRRVRRIDARGWVTTVAGNGDDATYGDGGRATQAGVVRPSGLAMDSDGNLYVAQAGDPFTPDARIRKIDGLGTISTVAGSDRAGFGGDRGPATEARLCGPASVLFDVSLGLLICELYNNRIRRVDSSGIISTIVGTGERGFAGNGGWAITAELHHPVGMALSPMRDLFIADNLNHRVRRVVLTGAPQGLV